MNFLAHIFLSGSDEDLMVGNFIADSIKGNHLESLPPRIKDGVLLHREIDKFTDEHPVFLQSKSHIRSEMHKFTGVVMDIFYDHFLAKNFNEYSKVPLHDFVQNVYSILNKKIDLLPESARYAITIMIRNNWLESYADLDKLQAIFEGMSRRTKFNSNMQDAVESLRENYNVLSSEFELFFFDMIKFVQTLR